VGRAAKPRDEDLRPAVLAQYQGRRARKGRVIETTMKVSGISAL
jgi:topoisomerase-4 subunit A